MQITETSADGLKREFKIVIPAQDIEGKVEGRLAEFSRTAHLPGFRPGKVPMAVIRQRYAPGARAEVLEKVVDEATRQLLTDRGLRPALQPRIQIGKLEAGSDLEFTVAIELLPEIEPIDFTTLELENLVSEVSDTRVDEALAHLARARRTTCELEELRPAAEGDTLVIAFDGTVDGVAHPGMKSEEHHLELGSGAFVDGFEAQLTGATVGEHRTITVTFPEDYGNDALSGKEAVFEVDVKKVLATVIPPIDDALAKEYGSETIEEFRNKVRERIAEDFKGVARHRIKRQLLDKLAEAHDFPVPEGMVEAEFESIWKRLQDELKQNGDLKPEDSGRSEDEIKAEYRAIAVRRVRLGLLVSEVGRRNNLSISQEEMNEAIFAEARRWRGQEMQALQWLRNNQNAQDSLRAPLFEDKVVSHILELAKLTERVVSEEELLRDPDEEPAAA